MLPEFQALPGFFFPSWRRSWRSQVHPQYKFSDCFLIYCQNHVRDFHYRARHVHARARIRMRMRRHVRGDVNAHTRVHGDGVRVHARARIHMRRYVRGGVSVHARVHGAGARVHARARIRMRRHVRGGVNAHAGVHGDGVVHGYFHSRSFRCVHAHDVRVRVILYSLICSSATSKISFTWSSAKE